MNMLSHWTHQGFVVVLGLAVLLLMAYEPSLRHRLSHVLGVSWFSPCLRSLLRTTAIVRRRSALFTPSHRSTACCCASIPWTRIRSSETWRRAGRFPTMGSPTLSRSAQA